MAAIDPGMIETIIMALSGGRDFAQRKFYNETRAGLNNPATAPDEGSTYGGIGSGLNARRARQGYEAQAIEDAIFGNLWKAGR